MHQALARSHQRTVQRRAEKPGQSRCRFGVLDDHIGLELADVIGGLVAQVFCLDGIERQIGVTGPVTFDQFLKLLAIEPVLALHLGFVQPFLA